jgi:hypothetical protein
MAITYINIFHSKALQKYTQIGIFEMKIYHLANLVDVTPNQSKKSNCHLMASVSPKTSRVSKKTAEGKREF